MRVFDQASRLGFTVAAACVATVSSRDARAQSADERAATTIAQEGLVARREGRDAEALALFERSLALFERASVRAQLGFAQQALGRWADAERTLERVAALDDPWVRRYRATIDRSLTEVRAHLGSLVVSVDPSASEVLVDGVVSNTSTPFRVAIGAVTVTARREGYFSVERSVTIRAGETATESIVLRPRPHEPAEPRVALRPVVPVPVARERGARAMAPVAVADGRRWIAPSVTLGAGVLSFGASAALWALRVGTLGSLASLGCVEGAVEYVCPATADADRARSSHATATVEGAASVVALSLGVAAVGTGVGLFVFEAVFRGRSRDRAAWVWTAGGAAWRF